MSHLESVFFTQLGINDFYKTRLKAFAALERHNPSTVRQERKKERKKERERERLCHVLACLCVC